MIHGSMLGVLSNEKEQVMNSQSILWLSLLTFITFLLIFKYIFNVEFSPLFEKTYTISFFLLMIITVFHLFLKKNH